MTSTFHSLETSKRSLITQQVALTTLSHNIANANTEGYTRQKVTMVATRPMEAYGMTKSTAPGQIGTGVEYTSITRIRDAFLDAQYRDQSDIAGTTSVQMDTLSKLEGFVNEPSDTGIRTVLSDFWNAWSDLSKDPENVTAREILVERTQALTDTFNGLSKQLSDLDADINMTIETSTEQANSMMSSIASLNDQIKKIESLGDNANDLRDQRDLLTDKLSKLVNVTVTDTEDGYTINMGGTNLVTGGETTPLTALALEQSYNNGTLTGGEVHGMFVSLDTVAEFVGQLDTLANTIVNGKFDVTIPKGSVLPGTTVPTTADQVMTVNGINGLHQLGYTLGNPATAGQPLFTIKTGFTTLTAESIEINSNIASDSNLIASSMRTTTDGAGVSTVVKGNNSLALLMSQMTEVKFSFDETATGGGIKEATLGDFYSALVGALGVKSQSAARENSNAEAQLAQVDGSRMSISGVSLDEEMSDMIKYQYAYSAAARFMTTFDEMLNKLINNTGVVGR
ncbi:flagellar hook-associated protein 1 FlgK [Paenibacillus algorifonticola]|uniref:Flagellar hook-associated protein 1 n=1 Tax=Paenibacillus algorifonticola TaxID=684063 RepID=A0A1I2I8Q0_9BACL|nr:flagellar hook-associated protein FlgK [Paenibacillus algorifonticola]SFF38635.1 flagellar hook-associated protein 1 FlgK [Paenibacillus algorifonticola]